MASMSSSHVCELSWLSSRVGYWRADRDDQSGAGNPSALAPSPPLLGVMCTMFAVGTRGRDWLRRVMESSWFAGLQPRAEDLRAEEQSEGRWVTPSNNEACDLGAAVERFLAGGRPPQAHVVSIAVMNGVGKAERSLALALASALAGRSMLTTKPPRVICTLGDEIAADAEFIRRLRDAGSAVALGGAGIPEDRLHHFPAQAVTIPRSGQWVGVDAADYLEIVVPGALASLHTMPSKLEPAVAALGSLRQAWPVAGLILHFQVGEFDSSLQLRNIDDLATHCREIAFPGTERVLFTTRDGTEGWVDLLVVQTTASEAQKSASSSASRASPPLYPVRCSLPPPDHPDAYTPRRQTAPK